MSLNEEEPAPTPQPGVRPTWELVVEDLREHQRHYAVPASLHEIYDLVIADAIERDQHGRAKYGTSLQPCNGRDNFVDAYQEALDLSVYLRNELATSTDLELLMLYEDSLRFAVKIRTRIEMRIKR